MTPRLGSLLGSAPERARLWRSPYLSVVVTVQIKHDILLKEYTTLKVGGAAQCFCEVHSYYELTQAVAYARKHKVPFCILGGGSNVVVSDRGYPGLVIRNLMKGKKILFEDKESVTVQISGGEDWDNVVSGAVQAGWWGIENMSGIPGTVGAVPIQNVGAYGQEAKDVILYVPVLDVESGEVKTIDNKSCLFSYRTSIFNTTHEGRFVVLGAVLKLKKKSCPNLGMRSLAEQLLVSCCGQRSQTRRAIMAVLPNAAKPYVFPRKRPTLIEIRNCIVSMRNDGRLPDPTKLGSAGTYFKSLICSKEEYQTIEKNVKENMDKEVLEKVRYCKKKFSGKAGIKVPVGFLIEACGLAGLCVGQAEVYRHNPAVLVNKAGKATCDDILGLTHKVRQLVYDRTQAVLEPEPQLLGFTDEEMLSWLTIRKSTRI